MFIEWIIIGLVIAGAIAYLSRRFYRKLTGKKPSTKSKPTRASLTINGKPTR